MQHSSRGGARHASPSSRNLPHNVSQPHPSHGYATGPPVHGHGPKLHGKTGGPGSHYPSAQQQVSLGDLSAGVTLEDLILRVAALGFPKSCSFVLGLLER